MSCLLLVPSEVQRKPDGGCGGSSSLHSCETLTDDEILFEIKVAAAASVPEMSGLVLCSAARNRGRNWRGTVDELTNFGEKLESAIDGLWRSDGVGHM